MINNKRLEELMDELNVVQGDVLFVHSSWDRLKFLNLSPLEIINKIKERIGKKGLLCMPTYPWLHPMVYFNPQKTFSLNTTPSALGFLSEIFRRSPDVYRSANPFFPISATGDRAFDLISGQENIKDLYDNESVFGRLIALNVKQLGLGVSVGLSTFIHMADWRLRHLLDFQVSEEVIVSKIELKDCILNDVPFLIIQENVFKAINSAILFRTRNDLMNKINFKNVEGNFFYTYYIQDMLEIALKEAENALKNKTLPCWYTQRPSNHLQEICR